MTLALALAPAQAPAQAPAPGFFGAPLALAPPAGYFLSGSGSGSKEPKTPGSDRLRLPGPECLVFDKL